MGNKSLADRNKEHTALDEEAKSILHRVQKQVGSSGHSFIRSLLRHLSLDGVYSKYDTMFNLNIEDGIEKQVDELVGVASEQSLFMRAINKAARTVHQPSKTFTPDSLLEALHADDDLAENKNFVVLVGAGLFEQIANGREWFPHFNHKVSDSVKLCFETMLPGSVGEIHLEFSYTDTQQSVEKSFIIITDSFLPKEHQFLHDRAVIGPKGKWGLWFKNARTVIYPAGVKGQLSFGLFDFMEFAHIKENLVVLEYGKTALENARLFDTEGNPIAGEQS